MKALVFRKGVAKRETALVEKELTGSKQCETQNLVESGCQRGIYSSRAAAACSVERTAPTKLFLGRRYNSRVASSLMSAVNLSFPRSCQVVPHYTSPLHTILQFLCLIPSRHFCVISCPVPSHHAKPETGISTSYDELYPPELEGLMGEEEWLECMGRINRRVAGGGVLPPVPRGPYNTLVPLGQLLLQLTV